MNRQTDVELSIRIILWTLIVALLLMIGTIYSHGEEKPAVPILSKDQQIVLLQKYLAATEKSIQLANAKKAASDAMDELRAAVEHAYKESNASQDDYSLDIEKGVFLKKEKPAPKKEDAGH